MQLTQEPMQRVAAYSLYAWDHTYPATRLVAPWQQAGIELLHGTHWDQIFPEQVAASELVVLHRDFPRLSKAYQQVIQQARHLGKPVFFDLDDLLFELPPDHPDRRYHYISDALFPILQAIVDADAVTVSTPVLRDAVLSLNPNTLLLPTFLDERLWPIKRVEPREKPKPLTIGWIHDQQLADGTGDFTAGLRQFLRQEGNAVQLRIWGMRPPEALLALANVDWLPDISLSYPQFAARFSREPIDLAVIPHSSGAYYGCQSPLRYLELSARGIPGIFSQVSPYQDVITDLRNGCLASNASEWHAALEALAASADLRGQVAASAQSHIQQGWLLSQNAHRWVEALDNSVHLAMEHKKFQTVADQVAHISDQVRGWQRSLEKRINEREWEVRATNLLMARKDRQASEYIQQLGAQLEEIWSDPAWRLVHKARRLAQLASSPGDFAKQRQEPTKNQGAESTTEAVQGSTEGSGAIFAPLETAGRAKTFDLLYFAETGWDNLSEDARRRAGAFTAEGVRVYIVSQRDLPGVKPILQQAAESIFDLSLPGEKSDSESSLWLPADQGDLYQAWFDELRLNMGIHEAVCWIENPDWSRLAYRFRNLFGWKIVSVNQTGYPGASDRGFSLHSRSDLLLDARLEEMPFTEVRQALDSLYPKASIIILTYNNLDYTRQCLESISAKTAYPSYEIIIVDNASTDGTVEFLQDYAASHPNFQLVLNGENRGFATGNNQGIAASTGEYIVFLNNDTVVTQGWLSGLISHMRDPAVGAVGPVTNSAGNESKIGADYSEISGLDNFARRYRQAHAGDSFEIRMLALFCMLVRRSVIDQVGLLDERFEVGMYEDDDFSLRIRQKGFRILCAEDVYIHHWGSVSFSQLEAERYQRLHLENRKKFEEKWGTEWQPHRWRMDEV